MKNLKKLLVALVLLLCMVLPFSAMAEEVWTEQQIKDNLPYDAFSVTPGTWIRASNGNNTVTVNGITYTDIPQTEWGSQPADTPGGEYTLNLAVTSDIHTLEVDQITMTFAAKKNILKGICTPNTLNIEVPYGTKYEDFTDDKIKEAIVIDGVNSSWGINLDAYSYVLVGEGTIPEGQSETTVKLTPVEEHEYWDTNELQENARLEEEVNLKTYAITTLTIDFPANFTEREFGEAFDEPTVEGLADGDTLTWLYSGSEVAPTLPGTYNLTYKLSNEKGYDLSGVTFPTTVTIAKKEISVVTNPVTLTYNGQEQEIDIEWEGLIENIAPQSYIVDYSDEVDGVSAPQNAGNYTAAVSVNDSDPYYTMAAAVTIDIEILPLDITPSLSVTEGDYNGQNHWQAVLDATRIEGLNGIALNDIRVNLDSEIINAGDYEVTWELTSDEAQKNFNLTADSATYTVKPAAVTIEQQFAYFTFNGKDQKEAMLDTIDISGLVAGDEDVITVSADDEMVHAGSYTVTFTIDETAANNYTLNVEEMTLTINKLYISHEWAAETVTLGDNSHWAFNGEGSMTVTFGTEKRFPEGLGMEIVKTPEDFDPTALTAGDYRFKNEWIKIGDWSYDDIHFVTNDTKDELQVKYADLNSDLTPSVAPKKDNGVYDQDVTFTPAEGLEMTFDGGETWVTSYTFTEENSDPTGGQYYVRETATGKVAAPRVKAVLVDSTAPAMDIEATGGKPGKEAVISVELSDGYTNISLVCEALNVNETTDKNWMEKAITVSANGTYTFVGTDWVGHTVEETVVIDWIDTEAPTARFDVPGYKLTTAETIKFTTSENYSDGLAEEYQTDAAVVITGPAGEVYNDVTWSDEVELTLNGVYNWTVTDDAGNQATGSFTINTIDTTAPVVTAVSTNTAPTNQNVEISVEATEAAADEKGAEAAYGTQYTLYVTHNGQTTELEYDIYTAEENGSYTFYAVDTVGNQSEEVTVEVTNIDKTAPVVKSWTVSTDESTTTANVTIEIEENVAMQDGRVAIKCGGWIGYVDIQDGKGTYENIPFNGAWTITGKDTAGNDLVADGEYTVNCLDIYFPSFSQIVPSIEDDPTNEAVTLTFTVSDTVADGNGTPHTAGSVLTVYDQDNNVLGTTEDAEIEIEYKAEANKTYKFSAKDSAGNLNYSSEYTVNNIDQAAPVVTAADHSADPTNEDVKISLTVTDETKDAEGNECRNGASFADPTLAVILPDGSEEPVANGQYSATSNGLYIFVATDAAGNKSEKVEVTVASIDTISPVVTGWEVAETASSKKANVTITISDEADEGAAADVAGVETITVTDEHNHAQTLEVVNGAATFVAECNGEYTIAGTDKAGNELIAEGAYVVNVIDVAKPVIGTITPDYLNSVPVNAAFNLTFTVTDEHKDAEGAAHTTGSTLTVLCNGVEIGSTAEGSITIEHEVSANGEYVFTAVDTAGNEAVSVEYVVSNLDLVAPEITNLKASTTEPTSEDVTLTFDVSDNTSAGAGNAGVAKIEVAYEDGEAAEIENPEYVVSANGTYTFTITDHAGNTDAESITVDNIDVVNPVAEFSGYETTDPTAETVTLAFTISDEGKDGEGNATAEAKCGVKSAVLSHESMEDVALTDADTTYVVKYNGEYTLTVVDMAGNKTVDTIEVTNIDVAAPTLEISSSIAPYTATSGAVRVEFSAEDTGVDADGNETAQASFGIATIEIKHASYEKATVLEAQGAHTYTETFDALYNGVYTIVVTDLAGNTVEKTIEIFNIDQVNPTVEIAEAVEPADATAGEVVISFTADDKGTDLKDNATGDEFFGIASIKVEHEKFTKELGTTDRKVSVPYNGEYTITVTDLAGNTVTDKITVSNIDQVNPTIAYESTPAEATSGTVEIAFTAGDEGADKEEIATGDEFFGIASIVVEHESFEAPKELKADDRKVTVAYNGEYTFTVTDMAGNTAEMKVTVSNIDQVNPTVEIAEAVEPAEATAGEVVISFTADDKGTDLMENATGNSFFGIKSIVVEHEQFEKELETTDRKVSVPYNGEYTITVTDMAGNTVTDKITVSNIDQVNPTIKHEKNDPATATNGDVTIHISTDDKGADKKEIATGEAFFGVDYIEVDHEAFEAPVVLEADETTLVVDKNGTYTFTVYDLAGNNASIEVEVTNIDVVKPTFTHVSNDPAEATNGEVTINFTTADTGADVLGKETAAEFVAVDYILVNHASFEEAVKLEADATSFVVDVNGEYTFTVFDIAGNSDTFKVTVDNIDHTAPVAKFEYEPVYKKSSEGVKITLTATDAGEDKLGLAAIAEHYGLASVQVTFGSKTVDLDIGENDKDVTCEYIAKADGLYTFTFTDKGGNVTTLTTDMIYIDDIAPEVKVRIEGTNLRIEVSDSERLATFDVSLRKVENVIETVETYYGKTKLDQPHYKYISEPGRYFVTVYDEAGNSAVAYVTNPDRDEDGVSDAREEVLGTNPDVADTDDDGLSDGEELSHKTDPLDPDSDGDGLNDGLEVGLGSNPNSADSDSDGVSDYVAYQMGMLGNENALFAAASMLMGSAYTPAGETVVTGSFANVDDANAMMNNLEAAGLATAVTTSDMNEVKKELRNAVKKTNGIVVQFNANEAKGLAVVDKYLMQFSRQKIQFAADKGYDIAEMLGTEEFIVLSNADGSTVLVAPWSEAEQKTTGDMMVLNLVADRAVKINGTAGASHLAISVSGESIAYNKDSNVIVLNLAKGQSTASPVVDLVGLTFVDEMPVSVLKDHKAWGMENGEWKEVDFSAMKDVLLDQAQRTNNYRKVLLPGVEMTELEINIVVEVIMNRGDINAKTEAMKRSTTMYDLSKAD